MSPALCIICSLVSGSLFWKNFCFGLSVLKEPLFLVTSWAIQAPYVFEYKYASLCDAYRVCILNYSVAIDFQEVFLHMGWTFQKTEKLLTTLWTISEKERCLDACQWEGRWPTLKEKLLERSRNRNTYLIRNLFWPEYGITCRVQFQKLCCTGWFGTRVSYALSDKSDWFSRVGIFACSKESFGFDSWWKWAWFWFICEDVAWLPIIEYVVCLKEEYPRTNYYN